MRQRGFSLVEFMIAMTIGLFLVAGLAYLIAQTSNSRAEIERASRQIENGRYALDRIAEDLRHAGHLGEFYDVPTSGSGFPAALTDADPCATTISALVNGLPLGVMGYDGGSTPPVSCIDSDNYKTGTDVLVIRRASTSSTASASLVANQPYIQATPTEYRLDKGSTYPTSFPLTLPTTNTTATAEAPIRRYIVHIYYVAKCNVPAGGATCNGATDDGGISIPTLKMLELSADASGTIFQTLGIAEGIEHLQVDYGLDSNADGVADTFGMCDSTTPCTTTDFSNVVAVQVNLVARNTETSLGHSDTKQYSLGLKGYTAATGDAYRRHAYSALVRLNNIAMRREK
ncbi:MAG TPA: PilW family protein [Burkholderiales bacterium]